MTGTAGYGATLHWATAQDGFDSVLSAYNYYGHAFPKSTRDETDADLELQLFSEKGERVLSRDCPISTGDTLHIRIGDLVPGFCGMVAASMVPRGRMRRLSGSDQIRRPIATSYFMLYERHHAFHDFSHELFIARSDPSLKDAEWASVIYPDGATRAGVVVINNRPLCRGQEFASRITVSIGGLDGTVLAAPRGVDLLPGGSSLLMLDALFSDFPFERSAGGCVAIVRGRNIEQPLTIHLHANGDFNVHHF